MDVKKITRLQTMEKYMNILPLDIPKSLYWKQLQEAFIADMRAPILQNFTKRLIIAASNIMLTNGQFETINDMVRLLHPIRLRQVKIVKKEVIGNFKMTEK